MPAKWRSGQHEAQGLHRDIKQQAGTVRINFVTTPRRSKAHCNQVNAESRKRQLQNGRKALWHFHLLQPSLVGGRLEMEAHAPSVGPWCLILEGSQQTLFTKNCLSILTCVGTTWRTDVRCSTLFHLTQNSLRAEKKQALLENTVRGTKYLQPPGAKDYGWDIQYVT